MRAATILLVRHGEVEGIRPARFRGRKDVPLSDAGLRQAEAAADRLARGPQLDALCASPLTRCRQTAEAIATATGVSATTDADLADIDYGDWTWRTHEEMARAAPDVWRLWCESPERMRFPGGETLAETTVRAERAVGRLLARHPGGRVAIVTHDAVIRVLVIAAMGFGLGLYHRLEVAPCSLSELAMAEAGADLVRLSDTGHLLDA
jgi:probable phosphoglycerate mutase